MSKNQNTISKVLRQSTRRLVLCLSTEIGPLIQNFTPVLTGQRQLDWFSESGLPWNRSSGSQTPVLTGQGQLDQSGRSVDQFRQSADQFRQSADQFRESGQSGPDVVPFSIENMEIRSVKIHQ
ncbi:hypothetical protein M8J76_008644 [Diaphorina citri]|nr:hypothetical protein M8J76_008644 [Diaphorina citri]